MAEYRLRPRALEDIQGIWTYTRKQWSEEQADEYWRRIYAAISDLAKRPEKGRSADDLRSGYMRYAVGSHLVFYAKTGYGIEVVRVLHQRMDIEARLAEGDDD